MFAGHLNSPPTNPILGRSGNETQLLAGTCCVENQLLCGESGVYYGSVRHAYAPCNLKDCLAECRNCVLISRLLNIEIVVMLDNFLFLENTLRKN